ncbi:hypothetical protein G3U99_21330 [Vibrio coralliilyticus OCN008]|uniref:hypothetical protein n=1 Tax=Vibrio coralliilyticus TaxID=190893 RepID=UPI00041A895E|nr:hypothetical protein [Vibrio coralliilyticus]QIJ86797.1 hypothetical protein G3U99_21330 [Vibrio coralliilyticus OCN008]
MKTNNVIGLVALLAATCVSATETITFPEASSSVPDAPIVFPKSQHPIALLGGYTVEDGVLRSRTYDCGINISDLNLTAKLIWDGVTPKMAIMGDDLIMCRSGANSPFELDLNAFFNNLPDHVLTRLEVANPVDFNR